MRRKKKTQKSRGEQFDRAEIIVPLNEELTAQERTDAAVRLSEVVTRVATYVICHMLVGGRELLNDERISIAHAFLQRVTSTHMCNHKLTAEGLVYQYRDQAITLHEAYKTMTLTRTVYEHLAMYYFLYEHPKNDEERDIVWKYWQINSKKNLMDIGANAEDEGSEDQQRLVGEVERLRQDILSSPIGRQCHKKLDEWTKIGSSPINGSIEFVEENGKVEVRRLPYGQAWKYLFKDEEMDLLYRHLSMHCHPVFNGLVQYQTQASTDQGNECIPLYLSTCFVAYLCRLFLKLIPDGDAIVKQEFGAKERFVFGTLARMGC